MSKRSQNTKKRRSKGRVFFVDENLGSNALPTSLRKAGYQVVTHAVKYKGRQSVKDPEVIADCGKSGLILLTADGMLETSWAKEIEQAKIAVVILANNREGAAVWGARLTAGRKDIFAKLREHKKPCAIRFGVSAKVVSVRLYGPKRARLIKI